MNHVAICDRLVTTVQSQDAFLLLFFQENQGYVVQLIPIYYLFGIVLFKNLNISARFAIGIQTYSLAFKLCFNISNEI